MLTASPTCLRCSWLRRTRAGIDRKSTRLNSSHQIISYAVFCLKKKKSQYISKAGLSTTRTKNGYKKSENDPLLEPKIGTNSRNRTRRRHHRTLAKLTHVLHSHP